MSEPVYKEKIITPAKPATLQKVQILTDLTAEDRAALEFLNRSVSVGKGSHFSTVAAVLIGLVALVVLFFPHAVGMVTICDARLDHADCGADDEMFMASIIWIIGLFLVGVAAFQGWLSWHLKESRHTVAKMRNALLRHYGWDGASEYEIKDSDN